MSVTTNNGLATLAVAFRVPPHHRLYANALSFELGGIATVFALPEPTIISDKHSGGTRRVFERDFVASHALGTGETSLLLKLHGCNDEECFFPETRRWIVPADHAVVNADAAALEAGSPKVMQGFSVTARASGFQKTGEFLRFLAQSGGTNSGAGTFAGMGIAATVGLILLGGLALNLTPCVLPMIPINLAILGAGASNGNRRRGFALGSAYGAGMALAYGALGLVVVLTGSKFAAPVSGGKTKQWRPRFNLGEADTELLRGERDQNKAARGTASLACNASGKSEEVERPELLLQLVGQSHSAIWRSRASAFHRRPVCCRPTATRA